MSENQNRREIARVIHVQDYDQQVVINKGKLNGIKLDDMYLIYELGEEMFDLETEESLGKLEIVKGKGRVIHVQEKMSTIESVGKNPPKKTITKRKNRNPIIYFNDGYEEEIITGEGETLPFYNPKSGDFAKFIK